MQEMTTEEFLALLQHLGETNLSPEELLDRDIIEELDVMEFQHPPRRDRAARIVHLYLRRIKGEADEDTQTLAGKLLDIYDCRTCVNHIIQVIEKGIFAPKLCHTLDGEKPIFGNREPMTREEITEVCSRAIWPERRLPIADCGVPSTKSPGETAATGDLVMQSPEVLRYEKKLVVDVRPARDAQKTDMPGAIHCSLTAILEGTFDNLFREYDCVLFFCEEGVLARIAENYVRDKSLTCAQSFSMQGKAKQDFEL